MSLCHLAWGGVDLAASHGMPVTSTLAEILGTRLMSCASISNNALCSCVARLHSWLDGWLCFSLSCFKSILQTHRHILPPICHAGWQQHALDLYRSGSLRCNFFDSAQVEVVMQKSRRLLITIAAGRNWKTSSLLAACSCLSRALILVSLSLISDFRTCEWRILSGQGGWYLFVWCMTLKLKTILAWAIG